MPLLFDSTPILDEGSRAKLEASRAEVSDLLARVREPPGPVENPLGLRTAKELALDLLDLLAKGADPGCPPDLRRAIVNVAHGSGIAVPAPLKSSEDMPRVPGRSTTAPSAGAGA